MRGMAEMPDSEVLESVYRAVLKLQKTAAAQPITDHLPSISLAGTGEKRLFEPGPGEEGAYKWLRRNHYIDLHVTQDYYLTEKGLKLVTDPLKALLEEKFGIKTPYR